MEVRRPPTWHAQPPVSRTLYPIPCQHTRSPASPSDVRPARISPLSRRLRVVPQTQVLHIEASLDSTQCGPHCGCCTPWRLAVCRLTTVGACTCPHNAQHHTLVVRTCRRDLDVEEARRLARENTKDIIACGFDVARTFIFSDFDYVGGAMYRNIVRIQRCAIAESSTRQHSASEQCRAWHLRCTAVWSGLANVSGALRPSPQTLPDSASRSHPCASATGMMYSGGLAAHPLTW